MTTVKKTSGAVASDGLFVVVRGEDTVGLVDSSLPAEVLAVRRAVEDIGEIAHRLTDRNVSVRVKLEPWPATQ